MSGEKRIHVQFSGSLQVEDAMEVIRVLKDALKRRPSNCGYVMRSQVLGHDDPDKSMQDACGIVFPINEVKESMEC